jgi:hypothetical protein
LSALRKYIDGFPEEFYIVSEANYAVNIAIVKNLTEFEESYERFIHFYENNTFFGKEGITTLRFPFDLTTCCNFFDFHNLLCRTFDLNFASCANETYSNFDKGKCSVREAELSELEKVIYFYLVQYPEYSDSAIANKAKYSRQTVKKARERFYKEDLMKTRRIPNLEKLGFKILAFSHSKCNPKKTLEERRMGIEEVCKLKTPVFHAIKNFERVSITPFKDFEEFHDIYEKTTNFCAEKEVLIDEPITFLLSVPRMSMIKNHEYVPLVRKVLNI